MKKNILLILFFVFANKMGAQNTVSNFYISDTTGQNYGFTIVINDANFAQLNNISFYKYEIGNSAPVKLKELEVSSLGSYTILKEGTSTSMIQNYFNYTIYIQKNEFSNISKFSLELNKNNGAPFIIELTKPN